MSDFPININATSKENVSNKSTNVNTDQASNTKYPSVKALFDWATALFVPTTRTINGLDLNANITLTASDVGAPSGSGSSTGTNTGDETQASILSKLGMFRLPFTPSSVVTGTTSETQVGVVTIPPNSIRSLDNLDIVANINKLTNALGTGIITWKLSTSSTMPSGTTDRIAVFVLTAANRHAVMSRKPTVNSGNLIIFPQGTNTLGEVAVGTSSSVINYDFTQTLYFFISITLNNIDDQVLLEGGYISNF
jgi:hypothetical protein